MPRKLIFLVNPISGTADKSTLRKLIAENTGLQHLPFIIIETNAAAEYKELKDLIVAEDYTDVIICGGDGTINHVAAALQGININIGIIPMGSGNGLARTAGIP